MKIIINFLLISCLTFNTIYSQQAPLVRVKWYTFQEAIALSKVKPKSIMIDVFTDWCGWCKKMDRETFTNPEIAKYLNENYYPVKFNAESYDSIVFGGKTYVNAGSGFGQKSTHQFAVALLNGQLSYPSIAYFNNNLVYLGAVPGYKSASELEIWLNYVVNVKDYTKIPFEEYQKTFVGKVKAPFQP
jgi:thioredoxin-related protein